jgi:hypothetical protein
MKKLIVAFAILAGWFVLSDEESQGRGRGGFGGGGRAVGGAAVHSYGGGAGAAARTTSTVVGPRGGTGRAGTGGGSYTTKGGSTINYRGAAAGGTTPGGVSGGRYVGGVQVTTPGGKSATHVGRGGAAVGPGGNAVAGRSGATVGSGPGGSFATRSQGGVAIGPHGAVGGTTRAGVASGPGGTYAGASRGGFATGPYGAVAGRTTVAAGPGGTYYRSATAIRGQAGYVRTSVAHYPCFRPGWYTQYPGAWFAAGWTAGAVWRAATWPAYASYAGYPAEPIYYDYGTNVVYENNTVVVNGEQTATAEEYAKQATALADSGREAKATKDEEWIPLGVFAMVQGDEKISNHIFQLAVNKQSVMRGNYYDAVTDTTAPIFGSVDKKTQRAAWTVGDRKTPVYEAGIANLTKNETTMLAHYGNDRTVQFTLVRVEEPDQKKED